MSTVYDRSCLTTKVKNTSGVTRFFPFLPPHGRKLAADEEVSFVGTLAEALAQYTRNTSRKIKGFLAAIESGALSLVHTPSPLLQDSVTEDTKMIALASGTLSDEDPCWLTSLSEE